jgi:polyribonucleotide nucleotidyltransferase
LAASAALSVSDIPFNGPISEVRVAKVDGQLIINPTLSQLANATLEFIVAGSEHDINMVEGESKEIQEAELVEAIKFAHTAIKITVFSSKRINIEVGKTVKRTYSHEHSNEELKKAIYAATYEQVYAIAGSASAKDERSVKFKEVRDAYIETLGEIDDITKFWLKNIITMWSMMLSVTWY